MEICSRLGGMTLSEMYERMSNIELCTWRAVFIVEYEEKKRLHSKNSGKGKTLKF